MVGETKMIEIPIELFVFMAILPCLMILAILLLCRCFE